MTSQDYRTFISLSVSLWNDISDPVFVGLLLAGFKSRADAILLVQLLVHFLSPTVSPFSSFVEWVGIVLHWVGILCTDWV